MRRGEEKRRQGGNKTHAESEGREGKGRRGGGLGLIRERI